jgi:hypothetical protein
MQTRVFAFLLTVCCFSLAVNRTGAQAGPSTPPGPAAASAPHTPRLATASLYAGLVATQALDVHSTLGAIHGGRAEANPMVRWATSSPGAFIGVKAAATTGTVWLVERIRRKHPRRALVLLAAIDSAYAVVVAHNYRGR